MGSLEETRRTAQAVDTFGPWRRQVVFSRLGDPVVHGLLFSLQDTVHRAFRAAVARRALGGIGEMAPATGKARAGTRQPV